MSDKDMKTAVIIGVVLGIALSAFLLVYLPMKANHDQCGQVTLCPD